MKKLITIISLCTFSILPVFLNGKENEMQQQARFEGAKTCRPCHLTVRSGAQYKLWLKGPHARAYKTLLGSKAKEVARTLGINEPEKAEQCLKCHVTAYDMASARKGPKLTLQEGVSCEACHGAGSKYKGRKLMKDINEGKVDGSKYGLVKQSKAVCLRCHNEESPTYRGFDYSAMLPQIAHPIGIQSLK